MKTILITIALLIGFSAQATPPKKAIKIIVTASLSEVIETPELNDIYFFSKINEEKGYAISENSTYNYGWNHIMPITIKLRVNGDKIEITGLVENKGMSILTYQQITATIEMINKNGSHVGGKLFKHIDKIVTSEFTDVTYAKKVKVMKHKQW